MCLPIQLGFSNVTQPTYLRFGLLEVSLYLTEEPIARQALTVAGRQTGSHSVVFWRKWTTESNNLLGLCFFDYRSRMRRNRIPNSYRRRRRRVPPCSVVVVSWSFRRELLVKEVIRWTQSSRGQDCTDVFFLCVESDCPITIVGVEISLPSNNIIRSQWISSGAAWRIWIYWRKQFTRIFP